MTDLTVLLVLAAVPFTAALATGQLVERTRLALRPAAGTVLLTGYALAVSLATGTMLCLLAYLGTLELFPLVHPADWSIDTLRDAFPVPAVVGAVLGAVAAVLLGRACVDLVRSGAGQHRTATAVSALPSIGGLAVVDDDAIHAYAVPVRGDGGRVVVSTGLLRELSGPQRAALLAHERAHLRHRHHRYVQLTRLAAAANPLIRPVCRAVDDAIERWADAAAVRAVGDPAVVAQALGRAALAQPGRHPDALAAADHDVVGRVRALLEPPVYRGLSAAIPAVTALLCWASVLTMVLHTYRVVELSETVNGR